jgi:hypothetical protein
MQEMQGRWMPVLVRSWIACDDYIPLYRNLSRNK